MQPQAPKTNHTSPLKAFVVDQAKTCPSGTSDSLTVPVLFEPKNQPFPVVLAPNQGSPTHSGIQSTQAPDVFRYPTSQESQILQ